MRHWFTGITLLAKRIGISNIVLHPNLVAVVGVIDWEIAAFFSDGEMHSSDALSTSRMGGKFSLDSIK